MTQTKIGVTLGDPAGIGPEVVARALAEMSAPQRERCVLFGHRAAVERVGGSGLAGVEVREPTMPWGGIEFGKPSAHSGAHAMAYLEDAIAAAMAKEVAGIVTAPLSKQWAKAAGLGFPGHTELLAHRFGVTDVVMMFVGLRLRVALASTHLPLSAVAAHLTQGRVTSVIERVALSLQHEFGLAAPRLGIVGLNPHAGEAGLLGSEEIDVISPAMVKARVGAAVLVGPLVPDVAFRAHADGEFDALVAMYHDQALIPVKLLEFEDAVNVTLGLPIVRTSPDHGTAFGIAGTGRARARSTRRAMDVAVELLAQRRVTPTQTGR